MAADVTRVRPLAEGESERLLEFARAYYGPESHQARMSRFEWLYRHNPLTQGASKDVVVAVESGGRVVGCHWKTRLAWNWDGTRVVIPSLHDLAILPEYRSGQGFPLILAALTGEPKAALLGLSAASDGIYERMKCPLVPMVRLQKIISYVRTAAGMAGLLRPRDVAHWNVPSPALIEKALRIPYAGTRCLAWTPETFAWRFFHPQGPRHCLVLLGDAEAPAGRAVFSYGRRRGAALARLVDTAVLEPSLYPSLFRAVERAMREAGVAVATAACTSQPAAQALVAMGWREQTGVTARFFCRGLSSVDLTDVWGGSYDYGYDAA